MLTRNLLAGPFLLTTVVAALLSTSSLAQTPAGLIRPDPDSPIGTRNTNAPAELQQLEFLIGDWSVALVLHGPEGDRSYEARWHNIWIVNGFAIMQEWRDAHSTGAEFRTYNPRTGRWEGRNYYAGEPTWTVSEGAFTDGEFIVETRSGRPGDLTVGRERYFDIQPNSFRMVATRSLDGGLTWSAPTYEMVCTRLVE
jgi:hypothetical protein